MSLVSIVIPAFNQARFVSQAVTSALVQTHPDVEVIVVDDGSTDETPARLRAFDGRPNVRVIRQPNAGLPAARNRGLADARGEFVVFLDSDDELAPSHVASLAAALDADPEAAFAYCDVQIVGEDGAPSSDFSVAGARRVVSGDIFESLLMGGYFPPHACLVRRRVLDEIGGFDLALGGHADYEMWLRLSAAGRRAAFVPERLARYRVYGGSMSKDLEHMRQTRVGAIERTAREAPGRLASGISALQELAVDLHMANTWLRGNAAPALRSAEQDHAAAGWSLIDRFPEAQLLAGRTDQLGLWDSTIEGAFTRAVFLHPPASLQAVIPSGAAGRVRTAVAIHPDAWTHADACACTFTINVDHAVATTILLDPSRRQSDRRWVEWTADVPASATGRHLVTLETQGIDRITYGWAMFRDVTFTADVRSGEAQGITSA
jgi:GT2 family glycosyltransferase